VWQPLLLGLYQAVFAHRSVVNRIGQLETDVLKTGFQGTLGNKGALLVKLSIDDTDVRSIPIISLYFAIAIFQQAKPRSNNVSRSSNSSMRRPSLAVLAHPNRPTKNLKEK
jgi:hypothetical protein